MGCFQAKATPHIQNHKVTRVEQVDLVKVKLKNTRDRIQNLIDQHTAELNDVNSKINQQKNNGLKNKGKAIFLMKQRKQFDEQINNLNTRKQALTKTLGMIAQQQIDKQMVTVLQQSNEFMNKVQQQLDRKNWKQILNQAKNNNYKPIQFRQAQEDPEADALYAQLQRQLFNQGKHTIPSVKQIPSVTNNIKQSKQKQIQYS